MNQPYSIRRENEYLRQELGVSNGHPRYQWAWGGDLNMPMLLVDNAGTVIYDYFCRCGKNLSVHAAECNWTTPRPQWEMRSLVPKRQDQWILCSWQAPEASRDDWEAAFAGQPYPSDGYLIPVGDAEKCICVPPGQVPYRATTDLCIDSIRQHFMKTGAQRSKETKEQWEKNDVKERETLELRCKDAFPVHEGWPGEKHEWSHGGLPDVPSPNLIIAPNTTQPKGEVSLA